MFNSAQLGDFLLSHDHLWLGWFLGVPMTLNKNVVDELQKCDIFQNNWASWHVPTLIDYINKYRYLSYMGKWELLNIMWQGSIIYRLYQLYEGFLLNRATPSYHPWHVRIFHQNKNIQLLGYPPISVRPGGHSHSAATANWTTELGWARCPGMVMGCFSQQIQRIGLRENLHETIDFPMKYGAFL